MTEFEVAVGVTGLVVSTVIAILAVLKLRSMRVHQCYSKKPTRVAEREVKSVVETLSVPSQALHAGVNLIIAGILMVIMPVLIVIDVIPFQWRLELLVIMGGIFSIWAYRIRLTAKDLGIRLDNLKESLLLQIPLIGIFLLLIAIGPSLGLADRYERPSFEFFVFYVLVSSPSQEFIYRAFLYALSRRLNLGCIKTTLLLTLPYAWVHVIYQDIITLALTTVIGFVWAVTFQKCPNLFAVSFSHAVLGVTTICLGIV